MLFLMDCWQWRSNTDESDAGESDPVQTKTEADARLKERSGQSKNKADNYDEGGEGYSHLFLFII